ncbi:protein kinase domain-containing protein [Hyalangium rubrum]|uniref:histidine kinase n=1 Tax=Hyalangium rubrum TaxID=3103134 RepID=A0ABU5H2A0_9BACT|nr:ATP-binding protein [Hyalangium sp. s54d21]MDY7227244.1 ATP-binding protein [Hyalangium sp. s54d21]
MSEGFPQVGASPGEPLPGRRLGNRFELLQRLKTGRGISTWLGSDLRSGGRVVIKVTSTTALASATRQRLEHEAAVLEELDSSFVVPVLHLGVSNELLYLVTPYIPGESLQERLTRGSLTLPEVLTLGQCMLAALAEAHRHGVLHRDVKPANIIIEGQPLERATLVDFGLARSERLDPSLRDLPVGTARYLSPEQAGLLNRPVEATSDLYSAGIVLFEALSGRPAFDGGSVGEVLRQHLAARPKLRSGGVEVPRALEELVGRLLQTDPSDRYQSAESALADLRALDEALSHGEAEPELVTGAHDQRRSLTEPSFVGRHEELALLERELERTRSEPGRLVVVEAESGGGKSRLIEEFSARAVHHRAWVLQGQAVDQAALRPFQLFTGVATTIAAAAKEKPALAETLRQRLVGQETALCTVLPQLEPMLRPAPQQHLGPESFGEHRGIRALTSLLGALGTEAEPAVVLLDDCQWADELTLRALESWQQTAEQSAGHTMIVVSFRSEEVGPGHMLRRLKPSAHLRLATFGAAEVARMAESMAGALPHEATELVARLSEGNPFMASAVLHGLVEDGALVPSPDGWQVDAAAMAHVRSSRQAASFLVRRLKRLPADSLRLLSVGAVLGKSFGLERVASLSGTPRERVTVALAEPRRRHMLWEDTPDRYTFVHDKLREALLGLLGPEELKELHRLAARAIASSAQADPFELAYHFDAAGEYTQALPHALVAAERARQQFALETAELNYRIAERGAEGANTDTRYRITAGLGDVLMLRGRYEAAQQQLELAQSLASDRVEQARTWARLGELAFKRGRGDEGNAALEQGLRLLGRWVPGSNALRGLGAVWEVAVQAGHTLLPRLWLARRPLDHSEEDLLAVHLYSRLAYAYWYHRGRMAVLWAHLRELNIAERYPPTPELAQAYSEHSPVATVLPWYERAIDYVSKSLAMRREMGDVWGQGQSLHFYGLAMYCTGRFEECIERIREAIRLLDRTGDRWEVNNAHFQMAMALYRLGRLKEALSSAQQLHRAALAIGDRYAVRLALEVWGKASGGRISRSLLEEELGNPGADPQSRAGVLMSEAIRQLHEGDVEGAVTTLEQAERIVEGSHLRSEYVAPVPAWLTTMLRRRLEGVSAFAPKRRAQLLEEAERVARRAHHVARTYRNNLPHALRERGLLAAMAGHPRKARRWLEQSLRLAEKLKMRHERAQTLLARGQVGKEHGWPEAAEDLRTATRELQEMEQGLSEESHNPGATPERPETLSLVDRFPRVLEAGRRIASALTREAVFEAVRQSMLELLRAEHCAVLDPTDVLPEDVRAAEGVSRTAIARAMETGQPAIMGQGMPGGVSESMEMIGVRSLLCAPLQVRGKTVACVCASHRQVGELFGEDEERLTGFITTLASVALENAEGFERMTALSEERGRLYLEEQEAVRRRDDFLSIAAHELKTPLTSLQLHLQGLMSQMRQAAVRPPPERVAAKLDSANLQTQRLGRLVNELLDISRVAQGQLLGKLEDVDLVTLVRGIIERSREALARAECPVEVRASGSVVGHWDAMRLEQVVGNLITNAMKYGAGKPIEVTIEGGPTDARIQVRDHGIGIAPEDTERIFERFERAVSVRHYGGFGIGLWLVREIVQALGGTVEVESTPGQGSTFTITLPLRSPEQPVAGDALLSAESAPGR